MQISPLPTIEIFVMSFQMEGIVVTYIKGYLLKLAEPSPKSVCIINDDTTHIGGTR